MGTNNNGHPYSMSMNRVLTHEELEEKYFHLIQPIFDSSAVTCVFAFDNNYTKYFAVALQSLIENSTPTRKYDIVIFESDVQDDNKQKILSMAPENFTIRFFDVNETVKEVFSTIEFKVRSYWNVATYYKCFIPILMHDYERVLFLDSDMVFPDNIDELFDMDFEGKSVIGVTDSAAFIMEKYMKKRADKIKSQGIPNPKVYFNGGVIHFAANSIDAGTYYDKMVEILSSQDLFYQDQDLLNIIFYEDHKIASCRYDYQVMIGNEYPNRVDDDKYREDYMASGEHPVVIHYVGAQKPWINKYWPKADIFWDFASRTPYYEEIVNTDHFKNKKASQKLMGKMIIWFSKKFSSNSKIFRAIEKIAWPFACKL